jgi:hypothetical protein
LNLSGSNSASANDMISANGFILVFSSIFYDIKSNVHAPSFILLEFAPVIVPLFWKTGFKENIFFLLIFLGSSSSKINSD